MLDINWKIVHTIPLKSVINTKLKAFQYKYLMKIVPNNKFLYKCNITNTSLCDFCNMHIECNKHLFWECQWSRSFWTELEVFLNVKRIYNFELPNNIFWLHGLSSYSNLLNCILIYAKYFIFKNKYTKTEPSFNNFKNYLKYHENLERVIALSKDKNNEHEHNGVNCNFFSWCIMKLMTVNSTSSLPLHLFFLFFFVLRPFLS